MFSNEDLPVVGYAQEKTLQPCPRNATCGTITYNDNGTWTVTTTFRENDNGTITTPSEPGNGTWGQAGANLTTTYSDGSSLSATISGDRLTFADGGLTAVYERQ